MNNNKFYINTRAKVIKMTADDTVIVNGISLAGIREGKQWAYYDTETGICLCEGYRGHCIKWVNDNADAIMKMKATDRYQQFARDIELAREVYDD